MGSPSDGVMEAANHASASARAPLGTCSMLKYVNACANLFSSGDKVQGRAFSLHRHCSFCFNFNPDFESSLRVANSIPMRLILRNVVGTRNTVRGEGTNAGEVYLLVLWRECRNLRTRHRQSTFPMGLGLTYAKPERSKGSRDRGISGVKTRFQPYHRVVRALSLISPG